MKIKIWHWHIWAKSFSAFLSKEDNMIDLGIILNRKFSFFNFYRDDGFDENRKSKKSHSHIISNAQIVTDNCEQR